MQPILKTSPVLESKEHHKETSSSETPTPVLTLEKLRSEMDRMQTELQFLKLNTRLEFSSLYTSNKLIADIVTTLLQSKENVEIVEKELIKMSEKFETLNKHQLKIIKMLEVINKPLEEEKKEPKEEKPVY